MEVTPNEVKTTVKHKKNGKTPGLGVIPVESIKHGPEALFELFLRGEHVPADWKAAYISNIYKKGDHQNCSSYRGISVTNSISRIYGKILKTRIEEGIQVVVEQNGFRAGRCCIDSVFTLKKRY